MTKVSMPLEELFEKSADADFVREMIAFGGRLLKEADVEGQRGAAHGERRDGRGDCRNVTATASAAWGSALIAQYDHARAPNR